MCGVSAVCETARTQWSAPETLKPIAALKISGQILVHNYMYNQGAISFSI